MSVNLTKPLISEFIASNVVKNESKFLIGVSLDEVSINILETVGKYELFKATLPSPGS